MKLKTISRADWLALLGLLAITLGFFWRALSGHFMFFHEDMHVLFYPMRFYYVECLKAGHLPLWNPYINCGYPQYAEGQIAAFYPFNLLLFGLLPLNLAFNYNVIIHYLLIGFGCYAWLRYRRLGVGASFIGALILQWSAFMLGHLQHPSIFNSVAWLPWLLLWFEIGLKRLREGRDIRLTLLLGGLLFALQILAGYPPIVFYTLLILMIYGLCQWRQLRQAGVFPLAPLGLIIGAAVISAGLTALQWLPTMQLSSGDKRTGLTTIQYMTSFGPTPQNLPTFIFPHYLGSVAFGSFKGAPYFWESHGYLGLLALPLIVWGLLKRRERAGPFAVMALIGLVLAYARGNPDYDPSLEPHYNPIYFLLQYIPGFNFFRAPGRYLLLWTVAGTALAAEGYQALSDGAQQTPRPAKTPWLLGLGVVGLLLFWIILQIKYWRLLPEYYLRPAVLPVEWVMLACGLLLFAGLARALRRGGLRFLLFPVLTLALLADLLAFDKPLAPVAPASFYQEVPWTVKELQKDPDWYRFWPWRVALFSDPYFPTRFPWARTLKYYRQQKARLVPNLNILWGLRSADGNTALIRPEDYPRQNLELDVLKKYHNLRHHSLLKVSRLLGVKYLLSRQPLTDLDLIHREGDLWLYRNHNPRPRAWVVGGARLLPEQFEAAKYLVSGFDSEKEVILEQEPPLPLERPGEIPAEIKITEPRPEKIILQTKTGGDGMLVLNEIYDTNWEATLDGTPTNLYRADVFLRGVYLPAGEHTVTFTYNNFFFFAGLRISLFCLVLWGLAAGSALRRPKPTRPAE